MPDVTRTIFGLALVVYSIASNAVFNTNAIIIVRSHACHEPIGISYLGS